jgi:hypothetical protein
VASREAQYATAAGTKATSVTTANSGAAGMPV